MALLHLYKTTAFFLFLLLLSLTLFSSSCIADDHLSLFINCGSSSSVTLSDGRTFVPDIHPQQFVLSAHGSYAVNNRNQSTDSLCQTARVFTKPSTYDFDIPQGIGTYILRFHFCDCNSSDPKLEDAQFNVSASGHMLLSSFSLGKNVTVSSGVVKEFFLTINSTPENSKLRVYLEPSQSLAFINALEVLSTKQNITEASGPHITTSGNSTAYNGPKFKVLETIYRINVGGNNSSDSYWRTWIPDDPFLINREAVKNISHTSNINYGVSGGATLDDAPNDVYSTAKQLDGTNTRALNPTWQFKVSKDTTFFVRVHFCDIVTLPLGPYMFNFHVYNKYVRLIYPFQEFQQLAVPFYNDYIVDSNEDGALNISIGPADGSSGVNRTYAFLNGLEIMQVKNGTASLPSDDHKSGFHLGLVIGLAVVGVVVIVILVTVALVCRKKRKTKAVEVETFEWAMVPLHQGTSSHNDIPDKSSSNPSSLSNLHLRLKIPFVVIQQVTRNFDESLIIGVGGFGTVYKGIIKDGRKVAVKRSNPGHGQGLPEFQTEIMLLSKIRHRHLVSLIGYCNENSEMILVYEFMEKGTLRDHLYCSKGSSVSSNRPAVLSWKQRLEICIGAAKGLDYLHTGSDRGIIHRDVKSTNILLDENYVAKVADFGLSRSGQHGQTHVSTDVKGTYGYIDPEYFQCMQLTEKSDVYSFGIVLLEVLCARTVIDVSGLFPREQVNLADWAMACHEQGQLEKIIDPVLAAEINQNSLQRFVEAALNCLKQNAVERPTMSDVRWDLEYALQLQKTATQNQLLQDDSMADASFNLPLLAIQRFPSQSQSYTDVPDDIALINTSTGEVFSQLGFDDAVASYHSDRFA